MHVGDFASTTVSDDVRTVGNLVPKVAGVGQWSTMAKTPSPTTVKQVHLLRAVQPVLRAQPLVQPLLLQPLVQPLQPMPTSQRFSLPPAQPCQRDSTPFQPTPMHSPSPPPLMDLPTAAPHLLLQVIGASPPYDIINLPINIVNAAEDVCHCVHHTPPSGMVLNEHGRNKDGGKDRIRIRIRRTT